MPKQYPQRTDSTQLPSAPELLDILKKESNRKAVHFDYLQKNDKLFLSHKKLSQVAGSNDAWISNYSEESLDQLINEININHTDLWRYIKTNPQDRQIYIDFYQSLTPQDELLPSEAVFVFGAVSNARIERAVELYNNNVAKRIIISGDSPHYKDRNTTEAKRMASFAKEQGVPENNLILEEKSVTLPDNVKRTIDLMESQDWHPSVLTIVASNFVLTRASFEWYKFCPWPIEIHPVSAHPQSEKFTPEGWFKDDATIWLVLNEYAKIVLESKIDLLHRNGEIIDELA